MIQERTIGLTRMEPGTDSSQSDNSAYEVVAKAIAFMRQHHRDRPDLAAVAEQVHLSEYHIQRLFTQWAGISPKRFSQFLTVEYAKSRITERASLFDVTMDAGLSSPGRLHDLFVTLEAMSPGEYKSGGRGLQISYGIHPTPFGDCLIAITSRGICNLHFLDGDGHDAAGYLTEEWPHADIIHDQQATAGICQRLFAPMDTSRKPLTLLVKGTNFQVQVWRALLRVPFGEITTYQGLAEAIGHPTAARAVGTAIGSNPIGYIIPCHRVIRGSGELGGYRWGLDRKSALIGWEASQVIHAP